MILPVNDADESVAFYTGILGFGRDADSEPFTVVQVTPELLCSWRRGERMATGTSRLLRPGEFDEVFGRVRAGPGLRRFLPRSRQRARTRTRGRRAGPGYAVYLFDPNRHLIELRYYDDVEVGSPT